MGIQAILGVRNAQRKLAHARWRAAVHCDYYLGRHRPWCANRAVIIAQPGEVIDVYNTIPSEVGTNIIARIAAAPPKAIAQECEVANIDKIIAIGISGA